MTDDELQAAIDEAVMLVDVEQKLGALERLRRSVLEERRLLRGLTIMAIVTGMIGIALSTWAIKAVGTAEASRKDARVVSCEAFNDQQERSIDGNEAQVREVFRSLTSDDDLTPAERERLDTLFADHDKVIELSFPLRDCSPEGIEAYFDDDPTTDPLAGATKEN